MTHGEWVIDLYLIDWLNTFLLPAKDTCYHIKCNIFSSHSSKLSINVHNAGRGDPFFSWSYEILCSFWYICKGMGVHVINIASILLLISCWMLVSRNVHGKTIFFIFRGPRTSPSVCPTINLAYKKRFEVSSLPHPKLDKWAKNATDDWLTHSIFYHSGCWN